MVKLEQKLNQISDLSSKELVIMSNLYLDTDFPHNFTTLEEIAKLIDMSKATVVTVMKHLEKKGYITKIRGYITFYYPIKDPELRTSVLHKIGFF